MTPRQLMLAAGTALIALSSACKRDKEPPTAVSSPMADSADQVIMAHHDTVIEADDHVILFLADRRHIEAVEKLFLGAVIR